MTDNFGTIQVLDAIALYKDGKFFYWPRSEHGVAAAFDLTSAAASLDEPEPKPEKPKRHLFDDLPFSDMQAACRKIMTPKWMDY